MAFCATHWKLEVRDTPCTVCDLRSQLQQAEEERDGWKAATQTLLNAADAANEEFVALRAERDAEHDAIIERGVLLWDWANSFRTARDAWERCANVQEAKAERDAAERRVRELEAALAPFARHFISSGGTMPGRIAKLDEAEPWTLADFGRASALLAEAQAKEDGDD